MSAFEDFFSKSNPGVSRASIQAVLALTQEGCTVPFISRYRKERTKNLDEVQVLSIVNEYELWAELEHRREFVLKEVAKQGALSGELEKSIKLTDSLAELEELYRPFKRKKKTKAMLAKEAGLEPLSQWIWDWAQLESGRSEVGLEVKAKDFINVEKAYVTYEEVLRGAAHILAEKIYTHPSLRQRVRESYFRDGVIVTQRGEKYKNHSKYEMYQEFKEMFVSLQNIKSSHRYLALRRGWQEGELKVNVEGPVEVLLEEFIQFSVKNSEPSIRSFMKDIAKTALNVHVLPSVVNEMHRVLKDKADQDAVLVFSENVRKILLASPFGPRVVIGVDPGLRTGCKIALIDSTGNYISHTVLNILGETAEENAKKLFSEVFKQMKVDAVAVGNGTAGRETESFLRKLFKDLGFESVPVVLVNESGASVYSASEVAREEFPELDLTVRGAISIARRLQDPLAELVKVEPKSIGVGQYQHDISQSLLKKSLQAVVESCVNQVGVNVNTASKSLLQYVSGVGPSVASNIVSYRKENGLFKERSELRKVSRLSDKIFEQSAGFFRVPSSKNVLDHTGIHPERYAAVRDMAKEVGVPVSQLIGCASEKLSGSREKWVELIGEYTFDDIIRDLDRPGLDPRDPFKIFKFREDIHEVKDLKEGMLCPGIVSNVTNFGAFVDIGVHQDGLVHISEISNTFIDDPRKALSPGDQVQVKVLKVDSEKKQISLSMKIKSAPAAEGSVNKRSGHKEGGKAVRASAKNFKKRSPSSSKSTTGRPRSKESTKPKRAPKPAFNNPFAQLAGLQGHSKK